jgi:hypothetical protein
MTGLESAPTVVPAAAPKAPVAVAADDDDAEISVEHHDPEPSPAPAPLPPPRAKIPSMPRAGAPSKPPPPPAPRPSAKIPPLAVKPVPAVDHGEPEIEEIHELEPDGDDSKPVTVSIDDVEDSSRARTNPPE